MSTKKILVTGGLGFIGSHTVVELFQNGYEPIIVDNLSNSYHSVLDGIKAITEKTPVFYEVDICNQNELKKIFKEHTIDAVIHFAAYKAVGESVSNPLKYYKNNVYGLISLMEIMAENNLKNIVFSSSCTVYGQPDLVPVDEKAPIKPALSPYGNTKQICEEILRDDMRFRTISLRYFNPVGAHPSGHIGELPIGTPNNLIPYITQTAAGLLKQITIHGNDYNTPDGTCIRDYIHVVDLAKAHVKALNRMLITTSQSHFEVFNLGTGNGSSVLEVIQAFEKSTSQKLNYTIGPRRPGDVEQVWANATLAKEQLNWEAEKTVEQMMFDAWNWQNKLARV